MVLQHTIRFEGNSFILNALYYYIIKLKICKLLFLSEANGRYWQ